MTMPARQLVAKSMRIMITFPFRCAPLRTYALDTVARTIRFAHRGMFDGCVTETYDYRDTGPIKRGRSHAGDRVSPRAARPVETNGTSVEITIGIWKLFF
jgi:hypothetical protein